RCERPFDRNRKMLDRVERPLRQPLIETLMGFLARKDFVPNQAPGAAVGLLHSSIEDALRGPPDIGSRAVTLNERDDRIIWHLQPTVNYSDRLPIDWRFHSIKHRH